MTDETHESGQTPGDRLEQIEQGVELLATMRAGKLPQFTNALGGLGNVRVALFELEVGSRIALLILEELQAAARHAARREASLLRIEQRLQLILRAQMPRPIAPKSPPTPRGKLAPAPAPGGSKP